MDSKIIAIIIIVLILLGIGGAYWFFGKEKADELLSTKSYYNISLNFLSNNKQIVTDYTVFIDKTEFLNGTSPATDFVRLNIPSNGTIEIFNRNRGDQRYFSKSEVIFVNDTGLKRVSFELEEVGKLQVSRNKNLAENNISIILTADGLIKNLIICERWSSNIIKASIYDERGVLNTIDTPLRYINKVDKCYKTDVVLNNNATQLLLDYKRFGELTEKDEIKLYFITGDYDSSGIIIYEKDSKYPLVEDIEYIIK